jgi:hypothetical protein
MPFSKFMSYFVPFTIFLEYDGTKYERQFTKEEVLRQVEMLGRAANPESVSRVMRRSTAKAPLLPSLQTLLPPDPPKSPPGISLSIPPAPLPKPPQTKCRFRDEKGRSVRSEPREGKTKHVPAVQEMWKDLPIE